jgi:endonuclease YncB( thermonuclease family)
MNDNGGGAFPVPAKARDMHTPEWLVEVFPKAGEVWPSYTHAVSYWTYGEGGHVCDWMIRSGWRFARAADRNEINQAMLAEKARREGGRQ